ncbi:headcase protein-like protein [Platysternon megacephalum]|uniref:Headcase protein-like protein n=1 Tax=Platysternon megacephalum TaxID=55544 RepID=A0A4D9EE63_9SAUR|nr:headcase protein-like protein [Platysternon megacephalum]
MLGGLETKGHLWGGEVGENMGERSMGLPQGEQDEGGWVAGVCLYFYPSHLGSVSLSSYLPPTLVPASFPPFLLLFNLPLGSCPCPPLLLSNPLHPLVYALLLFCAYIPLQPLSLSLHPTTAPVSLH